jgi:hypothetical protein
LKGVGLLRICEVLADIGRDDFLGKYARFEGMLAVFGVWKGSFDFGKILDGFLDSMVTFFCFLHFILKL